MTPAEVDQLEDEEFVAFCEHMEAEAKEVQRQSKRRR
jgi:hypothetical protein